VSASIDKQKKVKIGLLQYLQRPVLAISAFRLIFIDILTTLRNLYQYKIKISLPFASKILPAIKTLPGLQQLNQFTTKPSQF
jgi:hypothetical protein